MSGRRAERTTDLYLRLSDLRASDLTKDGVAKGLVEHERVLRERAGVLGWTVGEVIIENDMSNGKPKPASAYKRRRVRLPDGSVVWRVIRPGFRRMLDRLRAGKSNAVLALDLDRAARDPRDLEDLIDVVEERRASVQSLSGSLSLTNGGTDSEITLARVMVAVGNKSSRDTARRVSAARLRQALNGEWGGGPRPFGFCLGPQDGMCRWHADAGCRAGITAIDAEAAVIEDCSRRVLQGGSLRELALELRAGGVPTVSGVPWRAEILAEVLGRPRNAGLVVYQGKVLEGVAAPWEPIVDREVWEAVRAKLTDPARRVGPGPAPKWQGSGIYRCGICTPPDVVADAPVTCEVTRARRAPRYTCKVRNHLSRNLAKTDAWVDAHIVYALTHPRAYELLAPAGPDVDAPALRAERAAIVENLSRLAADEVLGRRRPEQVTAATIAGNARIAEIDEALSVNAVDDPVAELVNAPDPVRAWADTPLANRRVIIDRLCTVTILPTGRCGSRFDAAFVRVDAKHHLGAPSGA